MAHDPDTARRPPSSSGDEDSDDDDRPREKKREVIADAVDHFLGQLLNSLEKRDIKATHHLYEDTFNKLTDKYFKNSRWPSPGAVEDQISDHTLFIILYKELYYRHIYSNFPVTYEERKASWENYCRLLDLFIDNLAEEQDLDAALPAQWLWDILDEFIYHYQTYCAFRNKVTKKGEKDVEKFRENPEVFETTKVLTYLHQVIRTSRIEEYLASSVSEKAEHEEEGRAGAYRYEMVRLLGYFSVMQLLRMHSLLGDYHMAMKSIECIDFKSEVPLFFRIPACHITLYYYMGFGYMMLRRYVDAIRTFSDILVFLQKTSGVNEISYQYMQLIKKQDQMYALMLLCLALSPRQLDELLEKHIRDKYAEKQMKLHRGDIHEKILCFEELFSYACPKFISCAPPNFELFAGGDSFDQFEAHKRQVDLFLQEVKQQQALPTIGSYMRLYTAIKTSKLAQLCDMDEEGLRDQLLCVVHKTRQRVRADREPPLDGETEQCSEVQFYLDGDTVHINAQRPQRADADFFLEHILKLQDLMKKMNVS